MNLLHDATPGAADTLCRECGALVPAVTAEDYNGLCVRCRFADASEFSTWARTVEHALRDLYSSPADRLAWMNSPQALLNSRRPTDLMETRRGFFEVLSVIDRLRDGVHL